MERYLDTSLSFEKRAEALVDKMTVDEQASQLMYFASEIQRLGIKSYNWWNEGLHGVARSGTATVFPQAIAMASMFDKEAIQAVADVVSTETRAKFNVYQEEGDHDIYKGLTLWSPNVNLFRDPRWGRGQETYGEDSFLSGELGVAFVKGLQGEDKYLKTAGCAKHFAVHSGPEKSRHEFDAVPTKKDLYESYLPQFEKLVKVGRVEAVMGAYNRVYGEPCCASEFLINKILRGDWGFEGHFVSDCWALADFHQTHHVTTSPVESASLALKRGCDVNCGNMFAYVLNALSKGLVTKEDIKKAVTRLMTTRIKLGMYDKTKYDEIGYEVVDCKAHRAFNLSVAEQSLVMLKNNGVLPLSKEKIKTVAVIGSSADSKLALIGNYHGTTGRYTTILRGIEDFCGDDIRVLYSEGCDKILPKVEELAMDGDRMSEAIAIAKRSDVSVLCLGLDETMEGEEMHESTSYDSGDKIDLNLPKSQIELMRKVCEVSKKVVLILSTGSAMSIVEEDEKCDAIIQSWYLGAEGGNAVAKTLFGESCPSGKLPITFYKTCEELPEFIDYSMEGRTYKFMKNTPLYPFGFGLSYTKFKYDNLVVEKNEREIVAKCSIENIGDFDAYEISQVYFKVLDNVEGLPHHSLCGINRTFINKGKRADIEIKIDLNELVYFNSEGEKIRPKEIELYVGDGQPNVKTTKNILSEKIYL